MLRSTAERERERERVRERYELSERNRQFKKNARPRKACSVSPATPQAATLEAAVANWSARLHALARVHVVLTYTFIRGKGMREGETHR